MGTSLTRTSRTCLSACQPIRPAVSKNCYRIVGRRPSEGRRRHRAGGQDDFAGRIRPSGLEPAVDLRLGEKPAGQLKYLIGPTQFLDLAFQVLDQLALAGREALPSGSGSGVSCVFFLSSPSSFPSFMPSPIGMKKPCPPISYASSMRHLAGAPHEICHFCQSPADKFDMIRSRSPAPAPPARPWRPPTPGCGHRPRCAPAPAARAGGRALRPGAGGRGTGPRPAPRPRRRARS